MALKTIDKAEVRGKCVLMRVDFNVPISRGTIEDDRRIRLAVPSIKSVLDRGGRLVLLSHLGRPEGAGYEEEHSLRPCAERLGELLGASVGFPSNDCVDDNAAAARKGLADGQALLLENLRFHKAEKKGDPAFAAKLAAGADIYCNEAFGTSHRQDASMHALPLAMKDKPRAAGLLLDKELRFLRESLREPARPFVAVLGGAKVSDKIPAIEQLIPRTDHILIGGAMAYTFLAALGKQVGKSRVESDRIKDAKRILDLAANSKCELHLPHDHVCSTEFSATAGAPKVFEDAIGEGYMGLDIGAKTAAEYTRVLGEAMTIVWNGPMGVFEWAPYAVGTRHIAGAMADATAKRNALTIVGGGDSAAAAEKFGVADRVSHVSTGGGASIELLSGKAFPSLEALESA